MKWKVGIYQGDIGLEISYSTYLGGSGKQIKLAASMSATASTGDVAWQSLHRGRASIALGAKYTNNTNIGESNGEEEMDNRMENRVIKGLYIYIYLSLSLSIYIYVYIYVCIQAYKNTYIGPFKVCKYCLHWFSWIPQTYTLSPNPYRP